MIARSRKEREYNAYVIAKNRMGAGESASIRLNFNRSNAFYYAGETITGTISMSNVRNKIDTNDVSVELVGELTHPTSSSRWIQDDRGRARKENYIEPNRVIFWNVETPVMRSFQGKSGFSLVGNSYSYQFQATLPDMLPPTLVASSEREPHVKYYARLRLGDKHSSATPVPIYPFTVSPRVHLSSIPSANQSIPFSQHNRKHVDFSGTLLRGGVVPGQNLSLQFQLNNPKRVEIKRIDALLVQHRQVAGVRSDYTIFRNTLPGIHKFEDMFLEQHVDLLVPHGYMPPSATYSTSSNGCESTVFVHYELIFKIKTNGIFADFELNLPIIMGTDFLSETTQPYAGKHVFSIEKRDGPDFDHDDLPPSYDVAVGNSKKA